MDFCLIFVPFGHYDEPEILPYENPSICPRGVDVRHRNALDTVAKLRFERCPEIFRPVVEQSKISTGGTVVQRICPCMPPSEPHNGTGQ
jgi:hypothetical protein